MTGLTAAERDHVRQLWARKRLPDECKRIDLLEKDMTHLERAGSLLIGYQLKMADQFIVTAAKKSSDAAQKAIAAAGATAH